MAQSTHLKPKQQAVLRFIASSIYKDHYCPSVREICAYVGLQSTSSVQNHINNLEKMGYLQRRENKNRSLFLTEQTMDFLREVAPELFESTPLYPEEVPYGEPVEVGGQRITSVPLIGAVQAGTPITAIQNFDGNMMLPLTLTGEAETFLLRVQGQSMKDIGMLEGDLLVVRRQQTANNGDVVVARVDDEATVKRFFKEKDYIRLQPENEDFSPILVKDCVIEGKVVALIREDI